MRVRTPGELRTLRRLPGRSSEESDRRVSGEGWSGQADRELSTARLVHLAPAVLGSADSDHLLWIMRRRTGAGEGSAGDSAVHRGFQAERFRHFTAGTP